MKKNYQKPKLESIRLKSVQLLAGSGCTPQDSAAICSSEEACSTEVL